MGLIIPLIIFVGFAAIIVWVADWTSHRSPPPWSVEEQDACYVVRDRGGQQLAYVYFEDEPGRRSAAKLLTKGEARRIAVNIAKLPGFLSRPSSIGHA
jgi:hypothetical protein